MNKSFFFLLLFCQSPLLAQHFKTAPDSEKPVKQIIEWITFGLEDGGKKETVKGFVYHFRKDGKPELFDGHWNDKKMTFEFDGQNRLVKIITDTKSKGIDEVTHQYFKKYNKTTFSSKYLKFEIIKFTNERGQAMEEKMYTTNILIESVRKLDNRTIYNYNDQDSLFGEMKYYYVPSTGKLIGKEKTIHRFDPKTHQKILTQVFDRYEEIEKTVEYFYGSEGKLAIVDTKNPQNSYWERIEYRYKNGELSQEFLYQFNQKLKEEKVYKNGRVIRFKEYKDDRLFRYTDFQYVYF